MTPGERRKLVFTNLLNGLPVEAVMVALKLSAKEVMEDFDFVAKKVRSYRFERGQPMYPCDTVGNAKANRAVLLYTMSRVNLDKDPVFSKIITLPIDADGRGDADRKMLEIQLAQGGATR